MNGKITNNIIDLLQNQLEENPEKNAYIFLNYNFDNDVSNDKITYAELDKRARLISAQFHQKKGFGERAVLLFPPGIDYIVAFFACLYAGVLAVPSYPPYSQKTFAQFVSILKDAVPKFIVTSNTMAEMFKFKIMACDDLPDLIWVETDEINDNKMYDYAATPNKIAFLQYTSGSTSQPRGVMITHENLLHNLYLISRCFRHNSESRGVIWLPPYHDMGLIGGILQPLYAGFPVVLMSPLDFLKNPVRWLQAISDYRATTSGGPNFSYELCIRKITPEQRANLDLSSWDLAFNGAEPVDPGTIERFSKTFADCGFNPRAFYPCYGLAESTLIVTGGRKGTLPNIITVEKDSLINGRVVESKAPLDSKVNKRYVSCGCALHTGEVIIVDPELYVKKDDGYVGEIWVKSPSVALGYWNNEDKTSKIFNAYLSDTNEGPYLRTSDLGFIYKGELFVIGRIDDIILYGKNYHPYDIEKTAEQSSPYLRSGCNALFSIKEDSKEKIVLVQEIKPQYEAAKADLKEIIDAIRNSIAVNHELYVHDIILIKPNTLPKTSSGKIRRNACRDFYLAGTLERIF